MRHIALGLALSLFGTVALAQTPPAQPSPPAAPAPGAQQAPPAPSAAPPAMPTPNGPPEGMVVETPNGFYLVRPGETAPRRIDLGQGGGKPPGTAQAGPGGDMDGMADMADEGMPSMAPPHPHRPPPHPPEGKGARFRIQSPNLTVGVKCPDDEPIKACVDAISQLLDKASAQPR